MSEFIAFKHELPVGKAQKIVNDLLDHIYFHIVNGDKVKLTGIGIIGGLTKTSIGRTKVKFKTSQTILNKVSL